MNRDKSVAVSVAGEQAAIASADPEWDRFVAEFFDQHFRFNPSQATSAGLHEYDTELEEFSLDAVKSEIGFAKDCLRRLQAFQPKLWPLPSRQQYQLIVLNLKGTLLELEEIRLWQKDPDVYVTHISDSAFGIMARDFAPAEERLEALIHRERNMPRALEAAKENLADPVHVYTQVAMEQLPGAIDFFQHNVPAAFEGVKNQRLLTEFRRANSDVVQALRAFDTFLKQELLPKSNGDFRIGTRNFVKKLLYDEMIDIPLERLLRLGYDDLRENQQFLRKIARQIDSRKQPEEVLSEQRRTHPVPSRLLEAFRGELSRIQEYVLNRRIVTLPSTRLPIVTETPSFARALTFASMDAPGPYEKVGTDAFFNVTLPGSRWSKARTESYMGQFNRGTITSTAIHEVLPGHYAQFLWLPSAPSKAHKLLGCNSNAEGWAHYCEQMMLDEGYGDDDPGLRVGQLQDALLRNARYIVGISMHTGSMTLEESVRFFEEESYLSRAEAEMEALRGTSDPTYLVYTLGKLEILKLRDDYKKRLGSKFRLEDFHNAFLQQGFPPLAMVREALLGDVTPTIEPMSLD
jgi:uncharacterized protein (DUF885 family)